MSDRLVVLKKLADDPHYALELGKSAEHLVCADLMLSGYKSYLTAQGLPYDVVVDVNGRLVKIQVKAACFARNCSSRSRTERFTYSFFVRRKGKGGTKRLNNSECDIVALVALDIRVIAYFPVEQCGTTMQLLPPGSQHERVFKAGPKSWIRHMDLFPFINALEGDPTFYELAHSGNTHCARGHEYTEDNTYIMNSGCRACKECARLSRSFINTQTITPEVIRDECSSIN